MLCDKCYDIRFGHLRGGAAPLPISTNVRQVDNVVRPNPTSATGPTSSRILATDNCTNQTSAVSFTSDVIQNELLCFISNKFSIMPYDMLLKLCTDFYADADVDLAMDVPFSTSFPGTNGRVQM